MKRPEWRPYLPYVVTWFVLVLLVGAQLFVPRVVNRGNFAPLIGVAMAALAAFVFMDLRRSNNLMRIFACPVVRPPWRFQRSAGQNARRRRHPTTSGSPLHCDSLANHKAAQREPRRRPAVCRW